MRIRSAAILLATLAALLSSIAFGAGLTMFAAASATDALDEIGRAYQAAGRDPVVFSFASSSNLAKQIENGAPAALFLSADERWMDYLATRDLIVSASRTDLLGNTLVLVAPADSDLSIEIKPGFELAKALGDGRLAVGDPDHVPAGIYAKAALEKLGVWQELLPKLARAEDVRGALAFVERGEAPAGIVYSSDAPRAKVRVVATFPPDTHPPILYPLAIVAGHDGPEARAFYEFLRSPQAADIFEKYGFTLH
ncbi:MAG TPA: molybdate ABC transporter substrate-binding protein [Alphaproteobacteria bacterium]